MKKKISLVIGKKYFDSDVNVTFTYKGRSLDTKFIHLFEAPCGGQITMSKSDIQSLSEI